MGSEMELFRAGEIAVTDERFSVGQQSLSMENIRAAEVIYHHRTWKRETLLLAVSASCALAGSAVGNAWLQMAAIILLMAAASVFWKGSPRYSLALETQNQGRFIALTSTDRFLVESVGQRLQSVLQPAPRMLGGHRSVGKVVRFRDHSAFSRIAG